MWLVMVSPWWWGGRWEDTEHCSCSWSGATALFPAAATPTASVSCCLLSSGCRQMQDARCGASPLHRLCYIGIGNLTPTTRLSAETRRNFMHWLIRDGDQRRAIFWGAVVVWMTVCQLFYFDLFISIKEYMTLIIYLFLASPRAYSSDRLYS